MTTILNYIKEKSIINKISVGRITFLGMYLSIIVSLKFAAGFVPGIEFVTWMFMVAALFLPIIDGMLLVVSFNLFMIIIYGWAPWQIAYWFIWPFNLLSTKLLSKLNKNIYLISIWGFICSLLLSVWYFVSDISLFGKSFAILNLLSAIPINLIGAFTTGILIFNYLPSISKIFNRVNSRLNWYKNENYPKFKFEKKRKLFLLIIFNIIIISLVILLFIYNPSFLDLKNSLSVKTKAIKI